MNKAKLINDLFNWQDDYWMVGVSESHIKHVRNYINFQETHHAKVSFKKELSTFLKKYGWDLEKD